MTAIATYEEVFHYASKTPRLAVHHEDQLAYMMSRWTSLDLQLTEEFNFKDPCYDQDCNRNEESKLPPPMPYFDRQTHAPAPAPLLARGIFSRVKSDSGGAPNGNELLQGMAQSMQNLYTSRSIYNRSIGQSELSSDTECGGQQGTHAMRARVREFDTLLEGL